VYPLLPRRLTNKPVPLELIRNPPQLGINELDPLHMSLGPSPVLCVRCCDPRFTFPCPRAGRLATVHSASVAVRDNGVLARSAFSRFRMAPLAKPAGAEPRATAGLNQRFSAIWV